MTFTSFTPKANAPLMVPLLGTFMSERVRRTVRETIKRPLYVKFKVYWSNKWPPTGHAVHYTGCRKHCVVPFEVNMCREDGAISVSAIEKTASYS